MSHLDIGFSLRKGLNDWSGIASTFGPFRNVCDAYVVNFYNEAIETAKYFESTMNFSYKFTNFPWMIYEVLNSTGCTNLAAASNNSEWEQYQSNLIDGIEKDYIIWNSDSANSFWQTTTHPFVFNYSLQLYKELNKRFNKSWGKVWKLADIPGVSASIIPYLNDSGIYAMHLGFGDGGPLLPQLPSTAKLRTLWENDNPAQLFRWKDYKTGLV